MTDRTDKNTASGSEAKSDKPIIVWFRQDLRLADNPALHFACNSGKPVIALYILDEVSPDVRLYGAAQKWWLHHSLTSLANGLSDVGVALTLRRGPAQDIVESIANKTEADMVVWNRRYGSGEQEVDSQIKQNFKGDARSFKGLLMHEPSQVRTGSGNPYKVYTPFWKKFSNDLSLRQPMERAQKIHAYSGDVSTEGLDSWELLPTKPDWSGGMAQEWQPGEDGALKRLEHFCENDIDDYDELRNLPGLDRTSKLSPHLRFGEISPHQCWHASVKSTKGPPREARQTWRKELVWREFSYHLLQEWPDIASSNFKEKFDDFPWEENTDFIEAWQKGQTGYPIVDAGMRQLWHSGWMHNRVRMIVGSFLVKHLLQDWREGERWFWDTLVDGDPASNSAQWQWVAGTGADASPYFRVFNPILQAEKFDKDGEYIRRWVPELSDLAAKHLPAPWDAPEAVLKEAGIKLGETYPKPIVDHKQAREKALDALSRMREAIEADE